MKKHTKLLVILLSVALVCTALVVAVSAAGDNGKASYTDPSGGEVTANLAEALANVPAGGTVTLKGDCTLSSAFTVTKNMTIDLGGYKLTATATAFEIGANDITFTIKGAGAIKANGYFINASASRKDFTVNLAGDANTSGISILHTSGRLTNTTHGTWNFKNLDVVSTSVLPKGESYFMVERNANSTCKMSFDNVQFDNRTVPCQDGTGNTVVAVAGTDAATSSLTITNSAFYTQNSGIYAANTNAKVKSNITIENSIISCLGNPVPSRNYVLIGMHHSFGSENTGFNGVLTIKNSHVECNVRMFTCGKNDAFKLNVDNSTLKIAGNSGTDASYGFTRGKATVTFTNNSRILFFGSSAGTVPAGTRSNKLDAITPASGCSVIYDPIGDPEAPYVVVETGTAASPDFFKNYSFDLLSFTTATPGERVLRTNGAYTSGWSSVENFKNEPKGMHWDIKAGTLTHVQAPTNNYVRYSVDDNDVPDGTATVTSKTDPYFIMGLDYEGQWAENNKTHISATSGTNRKKVMVSEVDFATDSEVGYPVITVQSASRNQNNGNTSNDVIFKILADGTITENTLRDKQDVKLNPAGMWNRMSMVCITDPVQPRATVYLYLNGEYMGYSYLTNGASATYHYFQGIRFNLPNNTTYNVGASLCMDNVSFRCYTDYQFQGETDYVAATETSEEVKAVYYPERYIQGAPAHVYVSANNYVNSDAINVNDALANATANGADLDLKGDVKVPQLIKTNGIVSTNGYILNVDPASYGCTVSYDANGNAVYTFNEATDNSCYEGTVKFHIYMGADHVNHADNVYEILELTAGQIAPYYLKNGIKGTFTNNGKNLSVQFQNGWDWDKAIAVTPELLASKVTDIYIYPTFSNDSKVVTNGYVKNSIGRIIKVQFTDAEAVKAYKGIKNGETFVLLANLTLNNIYPFYSDSQTTTVDGVKYVNGVRIDNDYTAEELAKMKEVAQVLSVDFNGYDVHNEGGQLVMGVGSNTVMNVYSSNPGTEITAWKNNGTALWAGRVFGIAYQGSFEGDSERLKTFNAYLNIGKFGDIPGSNLKIMGEAVVEGMAGDNSCTITVDGILGAAVSDAAGSEAVFTRFYDGNIIIKNSLIAAPGEATIVSMNTYKNDYTPYVLFENCTLINKGGASNVTATNGKGTGVHIEFINCTSNGRLNNANDQRNKFGYGNAAAYLHPDQTPWLADSNLTRAYYNQPMTMDEHLVEGVDYIKFTVPTFVAATDSAEAYIDTSKSYYIVSYGCESAVSGVTDAKSKIVLPILTEKIVNKDEVVKVTWKKADGSTTSQNYVKGANVLAQQMSGDRKAINPISAGTSATLNSLKVDVTGWPTLPTNIQEATTINAIYTVTPLLAKDSIKTNLTLTSDFTINLYIPAAFNEYITVKNGETVLDKTVVNIGTEETPENYVKVAIAKACNKATENAVFTIVLKEGAYTATVTSTMSIIDYADAILTTVDAEGKAVYSDESKALMYYMLGYAKEAVKYFDGAESANVAVIDSVIAKYNGGKATVDTTYENAVNAGLTGALKNATVTLTSTPAFVFTLMDNFVGTVTITDGVNTKTYTFEEGNEATTITHEVKVYNFTQTLTITVVGTATVDEVTGTEINAEGQYNFASFGAYHKEKAADTSFEKAADSAACEDIIKALYEYAEVANWYKNETLAEKLAAVAE